MILAYPVLSVSTISEPLEELADWIEGNRQPTFYGQLANDHPISSCSQLYPVSDSPILTPQVDQPPTYDFHDDQYH